MDINKKNRERISAFSDDALPEGDHELALAALDTPEGRQAWACYHHIGDILRATAAPPPELSDGFAERLTQRLAAEPAPGRRSATALDVPAPSEHAK